MKPSILVFAVLVALCWGAYGPALAQSRSGLGSPFKPYALLGVAYLIWALLGGFGGMAYKGDSFSFTGAGSAWGFFAGSLGAWGALALTLAMFAGGNKIPHVVMAIVFGGAVSVAAFISLVREWNTHGKLEGGLGLWAGIAAILVGAILVTYNTPQEAPPKPKAQLFKAADLASHS